MNYVKLVHTADLHLGSGFASTPGIAAQRKQEQLDNLRHIIDICSEQKADVLLIAGDLFETVRVDSQLLAEVQDILGSGEVSVFIAPGNHDPASPDSSYTEEGWPENVHIFTGAPECVELPEKNVCVWGIGFRHTIEPDCLLPDIVVDDDTINILVMHSELVSGEKAESRYNPVDASRLSAMGFDYCALGHSHKATSTASGEYNCLYPGCPFGRGFDEQGDKGVMSVQVGKGFASAEFISCGDRRYYSDKLDVSGCEVVDDFVDAITGYLEKQYGDDYAKNIYDVTLTGALAKGIMPDLPSISGHLMESIHFVKLTDMTTAELDIDALMKDGSLRGAFVRTVIGRMEKDEMNRDRYLRALLYGLRAFDGEVRVNEDY